MDQELVLGLGLELDPALESVLGSGLDQELG